MMVQEQDETPKIIISGANSDLARHLIKELQQDFQIAALAASVPKQEFFCKNIIWRSCNPLMLWEVEHCIEEADYGIYFVQSLHTINHLTQARTEDLNIIAADNFAQTAKKNRLKKIIYIRCPVEREHKNSRNEIIQDEAEAVMRSYGIPVTTLRTDDIDEESVSLNKVTLDLKKNLSNKRVGDKQLGTSRHEKDKISESIVNENHSVCSVQKLLLPDRKNAQWMAFYYMEWLSKSLNPLIKVKQDFDNNCYIHTVFFKKPLLSFSYLKDRSKPDHALFTISGGILAKRMPFEQGTLEFRKIPGKEECLAAIHDFIPSLPWTFYLITQAKIHLMVMKRFKKNLEKLR
ncbi:hypothetical protein CR203_08665 [Salipaludibacillus neizhouensis]|uniref:Uncharacterized protein n=1 Tax=Salipaludibacillus neizhouensis TaxID=885475 RepID=A0A3A9KA56_9BACI|nr:hypothetical protein [Salipaludibacillus neizhouensis]RKL67422.1 hypothetical protein CR203_08665 [Salipaludibacillus neizhouensis]